MIQFNLDNALFDYEPYPIALIPQLFDTSVYEELAATYPDKELFHYSKNIGSKYTLSEDCNTKQFYEFLAKTPCWKAFFERVKSRAFVEEIARFLEKRNIDLRMNDFKFVRTLRYRRRGPIRRALNTKVYRSRFTFSSMSANGGNIIPHTDGPMKIITLVLSFIQDGEWDTGSWGGGTGIVVPKDRSRIFNYYNKFMKFDEVDMVRTFDFNPNQCVFFIKTFNSWHAVEPMTGPEEALRKTLIVNIEDIP